ncbi:hypothetical protein SLEP1_g34504 [Rubroshorea leprosula]|uniref:Secreted protein n=2 Tax=Rubroshorea leprosula TaxID=152421 RepID=A0AAV5KK44_9ROSI|nr:hypothetical protein SLEP1_g34504 [Rubroshorea leprosula]
MGALHYDGSTIFFFLLSFSSPAHLLFFFFSPAAGKEPQQPTAPPLRNQNFRSAAAFSFLLPPVATVGSGFGFSVA